MSSTVRNVLIVVAIAAAVFTIPGGGDTADLVANLLSVGITALFAIILARLYREHRAEIDGLGNEYRLALYGAVAVAVFAMAARQRLFDAGGGGVVVWLVLVAGASYAVAMVWRRWREYS